MDIFFNFQLGEDSIRAVLNYHEPDKELLCVADVARMTGVLEERILPLVNTQVINGVTYAGLADTAALLAVLALKGSEKASKLVCLLVAECLKRRFDYIKASRSWEKSEHSLNKF